MKIQSEKNFKEKFIAWFTISRVIITIWNALAFCYHFFIIEMNCWWKITILQLTALIIEYWVSGWYERMLIASNKDIEKKTEKSQHRGFKRVIGKYIRYVIIFACLYGGTYYLRLQFFYYIDWISSQQLEKSIRYMALFAPLAGPIMAIIVLRRKERKRRLEEKNKWINKVRISSSV